MAKDRYWASRALTLLEGKISRSRAAMGKRLSSPVKRRANTADLVQGAIAQPDSLPPQGREALMKYAEEFYGTEVARTIMAPYILDEPEPLPEEVV